MMRVGDRHRQSVGGIRAGDLHAREQPRNHRVDLHLFGSASADDGFLDERRRIFPDLDCGPRGAHQDDAPRLAELQGRLRVLVDEHLLDGSRGGGMVGDQGVELVSERREPARQRRIGVGLDLPVGDMRQAIALSLDQPPAGRAKAGIEAENPQASFSSSSSGTS
jgi:hypothetical protein